MTPQRDPDATLRDLFADVRGEQDAEDTEVAQRELQLARRGLLLALDQPSPNRWSRVLVAASATVALAAAMLLAVLLRPTPEALAYTVDGTPAEPGTWHAADAEALALRFSDGSELVAEPASDVAVAAVNAHGASVDVERGRLRARIPHRDGTSWRVTAGPFTVHVVGTSFETGWDPDAAQFDLEMFEGEVRVEGPLLDAQRLRRGRRLRVFLREGRVEEGPAGGAQPGPSPAASPNGAAPSESAPARPSRARTPASTPPSPTALARAGRHREAVAAADQLGWGRTLERASPAGRLALGDAARFVGRPDRAEEAYRAARSGGREERARSAFALGRLQLDARGAPAEAARWFGRSAEEQPRGPLAREARGRALEAWQRAGRADEAARAARRYLELHPEGSHAGLARRLLAP